MYKIFIMNKKIVLLSFCLLVALNLTAQVDNYCLEFEPSGVVNLGLMTDMPDTEDDYTLQFWFCPAKWKPKAALVRSGRFSIKLGNNHALVLNDGTNHLTITDIRLGEGEWCHVTLRADKAGNQTRVTLNNSKTYTLEQYLSLPAKDYSLWLGGGFDGRMDEIRLWKTLLPTDYESFYNNTLNKLHPQWSSLIGYWKIDQELCANVVNFRYETVEGTEATTGQHGTMSAEGVKKVKYSDNPKMKYRIHMAYDNLEHTFSRAYDSDHYGSLSNFVSMLGISTDKDGNAWFNASVHQGTASEGAEYLNSFGTEYNERTGVLHLTTEDATMTLPQDVIPADATNFTLEFWLSIDEWKAGAKVLSKHVDENNFIEITLGEANKSGDAGLVYLQHNGGEKRALQAFDGSGSTSVIRAGSNWYFFALTQADFPALEGNAVGLGSAPLILGEGLKCKFDDVATWSVTRTEEQIGADHNGPEMPAPGVKLEAWSYYNKISYYRFEKPHNLGFDSYSLPGYLDFMRQTAGNLRGQRWLVTATQPSDGSLSTAVGSDTNRKRLAQALAACANEEGLDGIDIDFEWLYNEAGWRKIGLMLKELRPLLHEDKIISVSMHNVTYKFPKDLMQYVDYFNIQQYGPQSTHSLFSTYTDYISRILAWGVPREKLISSYATISDNGGGAGAIGYNWNADNIADDQEQFEYNGSNYVMNSLNQVVERTRYARDNDLAGIMYWDICNDLPSTNNRSMARRCAYVINANVHPLIETVASGCQAVSPETDTAAPMATPDPDDQGLSDEEPVAITSLEELHSCQRAVNIINNNGLGIIYSNPSSSNVWLGESSNETFASAVNHYVENSMWLVIEHSGLHYLYNIGRKQFVRVPDFDVVSIPCTFQNEPFALDVTEQSGCFTFRESGSDAEKGFMCAAPQNASKPVAQWTAYAVGCQWQLVKVPYYDITEVLDEAMEKIVPTGLFSVTSDKSSHIAGGIYTLSGQRLSRLPKHGLVIQNNKKLMIR